MPKVIIERTHTEFGFIAKDESGNTVMMGRAPEDDSSSYGIRPMQGLLISLGGCSGIDVVNILKKQRQSLEKLTIEVNGEREQGAVPALWAAIHIHFIVVGNISRDNAYKAVKLSVEKYCSVAETLRRSGCNITWEISLVSVSDELIWNQTNKED